MSLGSLLLTVGLGAAALALWLDVRLEPRTPRSAIWTFAHLLGAIVALRVAPELVGLVVAGGESPVRRLVALLLVFLPALVYCWLSTIWMLKLIQRSVHLRS